MTSTFTILGRLPGMNDIIGQTNHHRWRGADLKKRTTALCVQYVMAARVPVFTGPVTLEIDWIEPNNRRDVDNVAAGAKFILDGLVVSGRLPNDSRRWVKGLIHTFRPPDKKNPRVEVTVRTWVVAE